MNTQFIDMCAINLATSVVLGGNFTDTYLDEVFYISKISTAIENIPGGFDRQVILTQPKSASDEYLPDSTGIFLGVEGGTLLVTYRDIIFEVAKRFVGDACEDWISDNDIQNKEKYISPDGIPTVKYLKVWCNLFDYHPVCQSSGMVETSNLAENLIFDLLCSIFTQS